MLIGVVPADVQRPGVQQAASAKYSLIWQLVRASVFPGLFLLLKCSCASVQVLLCRVAFCG